MTTEISIARGPIDGVCLQFYTHVRARHHGILVYEWLLEAAKHHRLGGGSVFRAIAGFGRHGVVHHEAFFELADDLPVKVEFLLSTQEAEAMLLHVRQAGVDLAYAKMPVNFGILAREPP